MTDAEHALALGMNAMVDQLQVWRRAQNVSTAYGVRTDDARRLLQDVLGILDEPDTLALLLKRQSALRQQAVNEKMRKAWGY